MMKTAKRGRTILLLALDGLMIAMEIYALGVSWRESGLRLLRYYTQLSNILALASGVICACMGIKALIRRRGAPGWTRGLRYMTACALGLTLIVAGFLLAPTDPDLGFRGFMLEGKYLYLHTLCPLLGIALYFLHPGRRFGEGHALLALLPTVVYGAVSLMMNAAGVYSGPYPFLRLREQAGYVTAVGCIAVLGVAYAVSRVLAALGGIKRR